MRVSYCSGVGGWFTEVPAEIIDHKKDAESGRKILEAIRGEGEPPLAEPKPETRPPEKRPHIGCHVKSSTGQNLEIWENEDGSFRIQSDCIKSISVVKREHTEKIPEDMRKLKFDGPPQEDLPEEIIRKWEEINIATKCGDPNANMCGD